MNTQAISHEKNNKWNTSSAFFRADALLFQTMAENNFGTLSVHNVADRLDAALRYLAEGEPAYFPN